MKSQTYIISVLLIVISLFTHAQTTSSDDYNIYKTSLYDQYLETVENQPYQIRRSITDFKIQAKLKADFGFTTNFFQSSLTSEHYNTLKNNRNNRQSYFNIRYIIDQTGNKVYACSIYFPKGLITLSNTEIEAILNKAMTHKFEYIKKANNIDNFFYIANYTIRI